MTPFEHALQERRKKTNSLVCVGLDPDPSDLPVWALSDVSSFVCDIIDATAEYASCVKPNLKFYLAHPNGEAILRQVMEQAAFHGLPVILDDKAGDIGKTCSAYLKFIRRFARHTEALAFTANPYMGSGALKPFLEAKDLMAIYIVKTSNPGSGEFQDLVQEDGKKLWERIALNIAQNWNENSNCGLVVGATYPEEIANARKLVGENVPILIPGIGKQGGDLEGSVRGGGENILINSSGGIMFASKNLADYQAAAAKAAQELCEGINTFRPA